MGTKYSANCSLLKLILFYLKLKLLTFILILKTFFKKLVDLSKVQTNTPKTSNFSYKKHHFQAWITQKLSIFLENFILHYLLRIWFFLMFGVSLLFSFLPLRKEWKPPLKSKLFFNFLLWAVRKTIKKIQKSMENFHNFLDILLLVKYLFWWNNF